LPKISNIFLMTRQEIGHIIFKRRQDLLLRQEDLTELTGITSKTIYLIENGTGNPSLETLEKITSVLGLEIKVQIRDVES
jgi:DNA-binding XRE family transcriptional regulator